MATTMREFDMGDLAGCVALYNVSEAADPDFLPLTDGEYRSRVLDSKQYDRDGHFVAMDGGSVVGEARCTYDAGNQGTMKGVAHFVMHLLPGHLDADAEKELFGRIVSRLKLLGAERIVTRADTRHTSRLEQLQRLGFSRNDYENHGMERPTAGAPVPRDPPGYRIRAARMPGEVPEMHRVVNEAFATRGKKNIPYARFARQWGPNGTDDVTGTFAAERESDGAMVGVVVSKIHRKQNALHGVRQGAPTAWRSCHPSGGGDLRHRCS